MSQIESIIWKLDKHPCAYQIFSRDENEDKIIVHKHKWTHGNNYGLVITRENKKDIKILITEGTIRLHNTFIEDLYFNLDRQLFDLKFVRMNYTDNNNIEIVMENEVKFIIEVKPKSISELSWDNFTYPTTAKSI